MRYIAEFTNRSGEDIEVLITTEKEESSVTKIMLSGDPVQIEMDANSLMDPIKSQSATISILTYKPYFDMYSSIATGVSVKITNTTKGIVIFQGFTTPCIYNQDFKHLDTIQLECISGISALEFIKYPKENIGIKSFYDIIKESVKLVGYSSFYFSKNLRLKENDTLEILKRLGISEYNFIDDDDEKSPWTRKQVLEEICKYFGVSLVVYGENLWFIDYQALNSGKTDFFKYDLNSDLVTEITENDEINLVQKFFVQAGADLSLDDCYTKISVSSNFYESETAIPDPLESGNLTNITQISPTSINYLGDTVETFDTSFDWDGDGNVDPKYNEDGNRTNPNDKKGRIFYKYLNSSSIKTHQYKVKRDVYNKYESSEWKDDPNYLGYANVNQSTETGVFESTNDLSSLGFFTYKTNSTLPRPQDVGLEKGGETIIGSGIVDTMYWDQNDDPREPSSLNFSSYINIIGNINYRPNWGSMENSQALVGLSENGRDTVTATNLARLPMFETADNFPDIIYSSDGSINYIVISGEYAITQYYGLHVYPGGCYINNTIKQTNKDKTGFGLVRISVNIGNKYYTPDKGWHEYSGDILNEIFTLRVGEDSFALNNFYSFNNNVSYTQSIDADEGYAIPITKEDNLKGKLKVKFYFPVVRGGYSYKYEYYGGKDSTGWSTSNNVLNLIPEFWFRNLKFQIITNNANEDDIVYYNIPEETNVNEFDELELKITTQRPDKRPSVSSVVYLPTNDYQLTLFDRCIGKNQAQELNLVEKYLGHYSTPKKKLISTTVNEAKPFTTFYYPDILDGKFQVFSENLDVKKDQLELTIMEY